MENENVITEETERMLINLNDESYFDGNLFQLIGYKILGFLVSVFTLGICYPWVFVWSITGKLNTL